MGKFKAMNEKYNSKKYSLGITIFTAVLVCFLIYVNAHLGSFIRIEGYSMEPTLTHEELGFLYKGAYHNEMPKRFDIIGFNLEGNSECYIKRIIGMPGESIMIDLGVVFINGERLVEPIETNISESYSAGDEIILGSNEYFVLGDNRDDSYDSRQRSFGTVNSELILGKYKKL